MIFDSELVSALTYAAVFGLLVEISKQMSPTRLIRAMNTDGTGAANLTVINADTGNDSGATNHLGFAKIPKSWTRIELHNDKIPVWMENSCPEHLVQVVVLTRDAKCQELKIVRH
jgi:hypothetical protein